MTKEANEVRADCWVEVSALFIIEWEKWGRTRSNDFVDHIFKVTGDKAAALRAAAAEKPLCAKCEGSGLMDHPSGARAAGSTQCDRCNGSRFEPDYRERAERAEAKLSAAAADFERLSREKHIALTASANAQARVAVLEGAKNHAYSERNKMVAALTKLFPASLERHDGAEWEDDWRWVVFIDLPTGQVSWHIHDSEIAQFDHLPRKQGRKWDGHTTEEKYQRLAALTPHSPGQSQGEETR